MTIEPGGLYHAGSSNVNRALFNTQLRSGPVAGPCTHWILGASTSSQLKSCKINSGDLESNQRSGGETIGTSVGKCLVSMTCLRLDAK